jgi:hypothetical protein
MNYENFGSIAEILEELEWKAINFCMDFIRQMSV